MIWAGKHRRGNRQRLHSIRLRGESLESRQLLSAAPVAVNDSYIMQPTDTLDTRGSYWTAATFPGLTELQAISLPNGISGDAYSALQRKIAVISADGHDLQVFDTRSQIVVASLHTDTNFRGLSVTSDDRYLYVVEGLAPNYVSPLTESDAHNWVRQLDLSTLSWTSSSYYEPIINVQGINSGQLLLAAQTLESNSNSLVALATFTGQDQPLERVDGYTVSGQSGRVLYSAALGQAYLDQPIAITSGPNNTYGYYNYLAVAVFQVTATSISLGNSVFDPASRGAQNTVVLSADGNAFVNGHVLHEIGVPRLGRSPLLGTQYLSDVPQAVSTGLSFDQNGPIAIELGDRLGNYPHDRSATFFATSNRFSEIWAYDALSNSLVDYSIPLRKTGLLVNDQVSTVPVTVAVTAPPSVGDLVVSSTGQFAYRAEDQSSAVHFTYTVTDLDGQSSHANVTIIVDKPPRAQDDTEVVPQSLPFEVFPTTNDLFFDNQDIQSTSYGNLVPIKDASKVQITILSPPSVGSVAVQADGGVLYTPPKDFVGDVQFTYRISDGLLDSSPATVTLKVRPVNQPPTLQTVGAAQWVYAGAGIRIPAVAGDPDYAGVISVSVSASQGTLGYRDFNQSGVTFAPYPRWDFLHGTLEAVNAKLATLVFLAPQADANSTVTITVDDLGSGDTFGGAKTTSKSIAIQSYAQPWFNAVQPLDVNRDGVVGALDALILINQLNTLGIVDLFANLTAVNPKVIPSLAIDCNGDGKLTATDVLMVINYLNLQGIFVGTNGAAGMTSASDSFSFGASGNINSRNGGSLTGGSGAYGTIVTWSTGGDVYLSPEQQFALHFQKVGAGNLQFPTNQYLFRTGTIVLSGGTYQIGNGSILVFNSLALPAPAAKAKSLLADAAFSDWNA